jgi:hypothetical protein
MAAAYGRTVGYPRDESHSFRWLALQITRLNGMVAPLFARQWLQSPKRCSSLSHYALLSVPLP